MTRIHFALAIVLSMVTAVLQPMPAAADGAREWHFSALLDGKKIGYQTFRLTEQGEHKVLVSEARYKVKILFVNVYSYRHDDREEWRGDCLTGIESRTDDNGDHFEVHGSLAQSHMVVDAGDGTKRLPGCVMTFAYWNPAILTADRLLNSETGEYMAVQVSDRGPDTITAAGREQPAHRYTLTTSKFSLDLWYSPDREWLGLETTTESGRRLRYRLEQ